MTRSTPESTAVPSYPAVTCSSAASRRPGWDVPARVNENDAACWGRSIQSVAAIWRSSLRSRALAFFATFLAYRFSWSLPMPRAVDSVAPAWLRVRAMSASSRLR
jgi:hypothetical protein